MDCMVQFYCPAPTISLYRVITHPLDKTAHHNTRSKHTLIPRFHKECGESILTGNAKRQDVALTERPGRGQTPTIDDGPVAACSSFSADAESQHQRDRERLRTIKRIRTISCDASFQTGAGQRRPTDPRQQGLPRSFEEPRTVNIADLDMDDVVIAVMGPTGSGKSTFIRAASGHGTQEVGHTLRSHTSHVITIRFWDQASGRHIVLVDTPGFGHTSNSDFEILDMISEWLNTSYKKDKLLSGMLYLHRITDNRMDGPSLKSLRVFRKLCGKDALDKVYLTTTMWDEVDPTVGRERLRELQQEYWKTMISQGAQITCCRSDDDSSKKIIQRILDKEATRKTLLQEEMTDLEKELRETEAGRELYPHLDRLAEKQISILRRIDRERKAAADPDLLAELQTEYDQLRAQIDDGLRRMQQLKLLQSFLPCFRRRD